MATRTIDVDELRNLVGQDLGTSDWLTVTQQMIDTFADVTGDHQWIHVDRERCERESPFQTPIAHGFLTLSLVTQLHSQAIQLGGDKRMGLNYGLNRVRFTNPVRQGSRIRTRSKVHSIDDFEGGLQVTWLIHVELENESKPALVAEWIARVYH